MMSETEIGTMYSSYSAFSIFYCVTDNGEQCFQGLPTDKCDGLAEFCNYFTFGKDPNFMWTTYICQSKSWFYECILHKFITESATVYFYGKAISMMKHAVNQIEINVWLLLFSFMIC